MSSKQLDQNIIPIWRSGYRFQFEPAQNSFVILYPEGMIKLNESAGAIGQCIDGKNSILDITAYLKQQFGDVDEIDSDVVDFMLVAQQQYWIDFK